MSDNNRPNPSENEGQETPDTLPPPAFPPAPSEEATTPQDTTEVPDLPETEEAVEPVVEDSNLSESVESTEAQGTPNAAPETGADEAAPQAPEAPEAPATEEAAEPAQTTEQPAEEAPAAEPVDNSYQVHDPTTQVLITPTAEDVARASASQGYIEQGTVGQQTAQDDYPTQQYQQYIDYAQQGQGQDPYYGGDQFQHQGSPYYPAGPAPVQTFEEKKFGNSGFSLIWATVVSLIFAALLWVVHLGLYSIGALDYLGEVSAINLILYPSFYFTVLAFFVGYLLVAWAGNRLRYWFQVLAGYIVAILAVAGYFGGRYYEESAWAGQSADWGSLLAVGAHLLVPVVTFILAKELPLWLGWVISSRAEKQRAKKKEYDAKQAELAEKLQAQYSANY